MSSPIVKLRSEAFKNQEGRCYYCGSPMWLHDQEGFAIKHTISISKAARLKCTAEHLKARCDGGGDGKSNIVAACIFCNNTRHRQKRAPTPIKYREQVQKQLENGGWHPKSLQRLLPRHI